MSIFLFLFLPVLPPLALPADRHISHNLSPPQSKCHPAHLASLYQDDLLGRNIARLLIGAHWRLYFVLEIIISANKHFAKAACVSNDWVDTMSVIGRYDMNSTACPHKASTGCCLTTARECCACTDQRPFAPAYPVYIDGEGIKYQGTRWERYCWKCKGTTYRVQHLKNIFACIVCLGVLASRSLSHLLLFA